jgi:hypothetical protein
MLYIVAAKSVKVLFNLQTKATNCWFKQTGWANLKRRAGSSYDTTANYPAIQASLHFCDSAYHYRKIGMDY